MDTYDPCQSEWPIPEHCPLIPICELEVKNNFISYQSKSLNIVFFLFLKVDTPLEGSFLTILSLYFNNKSKSLNIDCLYIEVE